MQFFTFLKSPGGWKSESNVKSYILGEIKVLLFNIHKYMLYTVSSKPFFYRSELFKYVIKSVIQSKNTHVKDWPQRIVWQFNLTYINHITYKEKQVKSKK